MRPQFDSKWKLPKIQLENQHPKLQHTVARLPVLQLPTDETKGDIYRSLVRVKEKSRKLQNQLNFKRLKCQETLGYLKTKWLELEKNEENFRNLVVLHNKFVRNNLEKRLRAKVGILQNQALSKARGKNVEDLREEMKVARYLVSEFKKQIEKHDIYDVFLTKVISCDGSPYKTINDLLTRYEMLEMVREQRLKVQKIESQRVITVDQDMRSMVHSNNVMLIGLRNDLNNLRCRFEDICRKNLTTESVITSIVNRTNQLTVEVSSCQYMIDAIYRYICHRTKTPQGDYALNEVQSKIDILKKTLGVWEKIVDSPVLAKIRKSKMRRKSRVSKNSMMFVWRSKPVETPVAADANEKKPKLNVGKKA